MRDETLGEVIRHILGSEDVFQENEVWFDPNKVSNIHMTGADGSFVSVGHGGNTIIVFIYHGRCSLWDTKVVENSTDM